MTVSYIFRICIYVVLVWVQPAKKAPRGRPSPPAAVRRTMERKRQKLVGQDKGGLTEQQTKGTATTTIQKKGNTQNKPAE